jgi:hypothetical protein
MMLGSHDSHEDLKELLGPLQETVFFGDDSSLGLRTPKVFRRVVSL